MTENREQKTNKKRAVCVIIAVLFIFFGEFFIFGTYARYVIGEFAGKDASVGKWAVALKKGDSPLSQSFELVLKPEADPNIADGKFAPSSTIETELVLDLTGTEVAVDYNLKVGTYVFGNKIQTGDIVFTVTDNGSPVVLGSETYVGIADARVHNLKFVLHWNADGDSASDVNFAMNNTAISLPVSLSVRQHTDGAGTDESRKAVSAISYLETTESKTRTKNPANFVFDRQDILSDNPESGFYSTSKIKLSESGRYETFNGSTPVTKSETSKLLYVKVDLSDFSDSMNGGKGDKELTTAAIAALDELLEQIKQNDNTVILRFVYDNDASAAIPGVDKVEPAQTTLLKHIEQLSATFKEYASTISVIQVGFYGLFGECYYNTDAVTNGATFYPETVNKLLTATSGTEITIAVRAPQYYCWYKNIDIKNIESDKTTATEGAYRVGIFNDAYGSDATDMGTYADREKETNWLHDQSAHTYFGGEAIPTSGAIGGVGAYNTPSYFVNEAYKLHTSYLNWEWNQAIHQQWANIEYTEKDSFSKSYTVEGKNYALAYIESHLGYRFVVKEVKTYPTAVVGETIPIDITVLNTGFANLVKSKRCDIVIVNSGGTVAKEYTGVDIDFRNFPSQQLATQSVNVALPSELAKGKYKMYLRVSSGEKLNNEMYYSAIRLANNGMWNETLQANYIAEIDIV